jgi:hypothetical protein
MPEQVKRISFRIDKGKQVNDFVIDLTEMVSKTSYSSETKNVLWEVIDHYENKLRSSETLNSITLKRVMMMVFRNEDRFKSLITDNDEETLNNFVQSIEGSLTPCVPTMSVDTTPSEGERLQGVVKDFKQIEAQNETELKETDITLGDLSFVSTNENEEQEFNDIEGVEFIDIGDKMDRIHDLACEDTDVKCIFCASTDVLRLSTTEGYCNRCDRDFLITYLKSDARKSVLTVEDQDKMSITVEGYQKAVKKIEDWQEHQKENPPLNNQELINRIAASQIATDDEEPEINNI